MKQESGKAPPPRFSIFINFLIVYFPLGISSSNLEHMHSLLFHLEVHAGAVRDLDAQCLPDSGRTSRISGDDLSSGRVEFTCKHVLRRHTP